MSMLRTFIAVDLPEDVKAGIAKSVSPLRPLCRSIRWVRTEGMHLTLKFLGEIPKEQLQSVTAALEAALSGQPSFRFRLSGMGGFPNLRRPRVLWIGVPEGHEPLRKLAGVVEKALVPCGFPPEKRRFSPHLTIGRVKSPGGIQAVLDRLPDIDYTSDPITAGAVKVMRSQLKPTGAEYSALKIIPLNDPAAGDGPGDGNDHIERERGEPSSDPTP
jgi:2'-5' RNA ligase